MFEVSKSGVCQATPGHGSNQPVHDNDTHFSESTKQEYWYLRQSNTVKKNYIEFITAIYTYL